MDVFKISFAVKSTTDVVVSVGNATLGAVTVAGLATVNKQYWLENDTNGNTHLCTAGRDGIGLDGVFNDGVANYSRTAQNFEIVELVGGRPIHRPHAY